MIQKYQLRNYQTIPQLNLWLKILKVSYLDKLFSFMNQTDNTTKDSQTEFLWLTFSVHAGTTYLIKYEYLQDHQKNKIVTVFKNCVLQFFLPCFSFIHRGLICYMLSSRVLFLWKIVYIRQHIESLLYSKNLFAKLPRFKFAIHKTFMCTALLL